jgi:hypothetical protein
VATALANTLGRDGTAPNQMNADLDLNSHDLLNVGNISAQDITVGGQSISGSIEQAVDAATIAVDSALAADASADASASSASLSAISEAGANAAREATEALLEAADLPPIVPNSMLVDNASGTARETKTFAQIKTLLNIPSPITLPYILAWENGVPGDGSDQTVALQALIDSLPQTGFVGGTILLKGDVRFTQLNLSGKRYIHLEGIGSIGSSISATYLRSAYAGSGAIIDVTGSIGIKISNMYLNQTDTTTFSGSLIKCGVVSSSTNYLTLENMVIALQSPATTSYGVNLNGSSHFSIRQVSFRGAGLGMYIIGTTGTGVNDYSTVGTISECTFNPVSQYPVRYPDEYWVIKECNFQAGNADGVGRAIQGSSTFRFKGFAFNNNSCYDVLVGSAGVWVSNMFGTNLEVRGNLFGAQTSQIGVVLSGTQGFEIANNNQGAGTTMISCALDGATKVAGGLITANLTNNCSLVGSSANMELTTVDSFGNIHTGTGTNFFNRATA